MLSFLAHGDFEKPVTGLNDIPPDERPPVAITHYSFQLMVGIGMILFSISLLYFFAGFIKKSWLQSKWLLKLFAISIPLGYIALEAGWMVTELGRQPWIIYKVMRTKDAVTPMPGIAWSFYIFTAVFISLSGIVIFLLSRQMKMVGKLYDPTDPDYINKKEEK